MNDLSADVPQECTLERVVTVPHMSFQLRRYSWEQPVTAIMRSERHAFVDFAVTPRPSSSRGRLGKREWRAVGPIYVVPPQVDFHASVLGGRQMALTCLLDADVLVDCGVPLDLQPPALDTCLDLGSPRLRAYMELILSELRAPDFGGDVMLESLGAAAAVELGRVVSRKEPAPLARAGLSARRRRLIQERCHAEALPAPDLGELARLADLTPRQFLRNFRLHYGTTPGAYVRSISIERAKRWLRQDGVHIKQIALDLGFASTASFSYAFRRATGLRPTDYREQTLKRSN